MNRRRADIMPAVNAFAEIALDREAPGHVQARELVEQFGTVAASQVWGAATVILGATLDQSLARSLSPAETLAALSLAACDLRSGLGAIPRTPHAKN